MIYAVSNASYLPPVNLAEQGLHGRAKTTGGFGHYEDLHRHSIFCFPVGQECLAAVIRAMYCWIRSAASTTSINASRSPGSGINRLGKRLAQHDAMQAAAGMEVHLCAEGVGQVGLNSEEFQA